MPRCAVKHCPHYKRRGNEENSNLMCHRFPPDKDRRQAWTDFVNKVNVVGIFTPSSNSGLCSEHFEAHCYTASHRLKKSAIPSLSPELTPEIAVKLGIAPCVEKFQELCVREKCIDARTDVSERSAVANDHCYALREQNGRADAAVVMDVGNHDEADHCDVKETQGNEDCGSCSEKAEYSCSDKIGSSCSDKIGSSRRTLFPDILLNEPRDAAPCKRRKTVEALIEISNSETPVQGTASGGQDFEIQSIAIAGIADMNENTDRSRATDNQMKSTSTDIDCSSDECDCSCNESDSDDSTRPLLSSTPPRSSKETGKDAFNLDNDENMTTPVASNRRRQKRKAYLGDMSPGDFATPRSANRSLNLIKGWFQKSRHTCRMMKQRLRRARKKVNDLRSLLEHLEQSDKVSHEVAALIQDRFSGPSGDLLKSVIGGKKGRQYDETVRQFAVTLNFHSPAAYRYVRTKLLRDALPHPRTLSRWFAVIDGKPGFTEESFQAIKEQARLLKEEKNKQLYIALVCDEMAIRKGSVYKGGTVSGYVDDGSGVYSDGAPLATQAWVFMAVAINGSWKLPVGYFLIDSMTAEKRSNVVQNCLRFLHGTGARVVSLTLDGTTTNISTVENLGAGMQPDHKWSPFFPHPETNEPVYVFLDAAHMLKLWRNTFGNPDVLLQDSEGRDISFEYIQKLHDLQEREGLRAGNKLTNRHVRFEKEKMKVSLAAQTLSCSVADALDMCRVDWNLPQFRGSEGTVSFIRMANDSFDVLNSTSIRYSSGGQSTSTGGRGSSFLKKALSPVNIAQVRALMEEVRQYVRGLKARTRKGKYFTGILNSVWKTGFLGFLCDLENLDRLYTDIVENGDLLFLPSYKLSQDHLEMFFGAVRSKGGWNNNPSTSQFEAAYKRLLVHTELKEKAGMNCFPVELVSILHVTPKRREVAPEEDDSFTTDHSYSRVREDNVVLSTYVSDVAYIAGFVVRKVSRRHGCAECSIALISLDCSGLIARKDRGGLQRPSADVIYICQRAESLIRAHADSKDFLRTKARVHAIRIFRDVVSCNPQIFQSLDEHIADQAPLDNHKSSLIRLIIEKYILIRMCHEVKLINNSLFTERIRSRCTKTVLFRNQ